MSCDTDPGGCPKVRTSAYCCCRSVAKSSPAFATPWTAACQPSLFFTISRSLFIFMSIKSVMLSNHLILCHPLLLLPSVFPASGSFPISWLFTLCGQSIGASASASAEDLLSDLYQVQEQPQLICNDWNQIRGCFWSRGADRETAHQKSLGFQKCSLS